MRVLIRNCIICDSDNYEELYTISNEHVNHFENNDSRQCDLNEKYGPHVIVKCSSCDCKYVRNVVNEISQHSDEVNIYESENSKKIIIEKDKDYFLKNNQLFEDQVFKLKLLQSMTNKTFDELSILDYGCGTGVYPKLAEILGFEKISAFDAMYTDGHQLSYETANFTNINVISDVDQLSQNTKFDIIICTAVIEHVVSVKKIFNDFKKLSKPGTILLFSNPVMDIEKDASSLSKSVELKTNKLEKKYLQYHLGHINFMLGKQVNHLFNVYGFEIISIHPSNPRSNLKERLKNIYVKIFPKSTRSQYLCKKI
jgi:2-polyprenyl-3-methyl-5-hydroxy-6-metoxy-1,4-benzoquinol methylase